MPIQVWRSKVPTTPNEIVQVVHETLYNPVEEVKSDDEGRWVPGTKVARKVTIT